MWFPSPNLVPGLFLSVGDPHGGGEGNPNSGRGAGVGVFRGFRGYSIGAPGATAAWPSPEMPDDLFFVTENTELGEPHPPRVTFYGSLRNPRIAVGNGGGESTLEYFDEFYATINDEFDVEKEFIRTCR